MEFDEFVEQYFEYVVEEVGEYKADEIFSNLTDSDLLDIMDDRAKLLGVNQMNCNHCLELYDRHCEYCDACPEQNCCEGE